MPRSHRPHIASLRNDVVPRYHRQERQIPYFDDDEIYCIHTLIENGTCRTSYIAEAMFKVQAYGKLKDIRHSDGGQHPGPLIRVEPCDIRNVHDDRKEWWAKRTSGDLKDYTELAWKHCLWVTEQMMIGTIDEAMKYLFKKYERKYRRGTLKAAWVRELRAQYYHVVS